jgi:hypothetical protein
MGWSFESTYPKGMSASEKWMCCLDKKTHIIDHVLYQKLLVARGKFQRYLIICLSIEFDTFDFPSIMWHYSMFINFNGINLPSVAFHTFDFHQLFAKLISHS